jgi:hypothetical protein
MAAWIERAVREERRERRLPGRITDSTIIRECVAEALGRRFSLPARSIYETYPAIPEQEAA